MFIYLTPKCICLTSRLMHNYILLFSRINTNSLHILQHYLPDRSTPMLFSRPRRHNKTLITKTSELNDRDFIIRNIYKDLY